MPSPEPPTFDLGPGTLSIGETGTPIDVSCLVNNAKIAATKDQGDATTKLCGTVKQGSIKYTYALSGNVDTDIGDAAGFFALTQDHAGEEMEFSFMPSTEAGTEAAGTLIIDPLDFGGDTMGDPMASDFEFSVTDKPSYTYGTPAP
jgi:hypothetical protein